MAVRTADAGAFVAAHAPVGGLDLVFDSAALSIASRDALRSAGARTWISLDATEVDAAGELGAVTGAWILPPAGPRDAVVFAVQSAATALRARAPDLRVGLVLTGVTRDLAVATSLAPYFDAVRVPPLHPDGLTEVGREYAGLEVWRDAESDDVLLATRGSGGARVVLPAVDPVRTVRQLAALAPLLVDGLTPLADLRVTCDRCRSAAYLHPDTLHAIVVVEAADPLGRLRIEPGAARATTIDVDEPGASAVPVETSAARVAATGVAARRLVADLAGWRGGDENVFRATVAVSAARQLTADEILARHQAWRARQSAFAQTIISSGTTVLTFDVPGFAGPVTITAATRVFARGALVELEQRDIRMNGVDMSSGGHAPRLPLVEAERVMTPPLVVTLGAAYAYRLDGRDRIAGRDCYVLSFTPRVEGRTALQGRAWLDTASFALVRMDAAQTNLGGAIVSSRQRDEFAPIRAGERDVWLPRRSTVDQIYQAAGLRTPIHRVVETSAHRVNDPAFDAERAAVLRSNAVVLHDTPRGYQYLVPAPAGADSGSIRVPAPRAGRRVVSLAFGVIDDPNITVPLPYAGVSYLDFDVLGRGIQLSGFFGGTYGQAAWTVPGVIRRGWQLTGRAAAIAASYNDRSFANGVEQYGENIRQRPAHADTALVIPLSPRVQLRAGYEFDYTAFEGGDDTAPTFVVPANAVVHGARLAIDVQRGPWSAIAWWNPARRQGWRPWGLPGSRDYEPGTEDFQRYGVTVGRSWVVRPGSVARLEATWADGHDLDRFSRYTVDGFDNPLRGYPSASLRYDRGLVVHGVATWTPIGRVRLDGFADYAAVHDPGFGPGLRSYPGIGATAELPLPARLLLSVEWGYGFEGRNTDGSKGTQVVRVAGVKVF